jgi:hypothetical protein
MACTCAAAPLADHAAAHSVADCPACKGGHHAPVQHTPPAAADHAATDSAAICPSIKGGHQRLSSQSLCRPAATARTRPRLGRRMRASASLLPRLPAAPLTRSPLLHAPQSTNEAYFMVQRCKGSGCTNFADRVRVPVSGTAVGSINTSVRYVDSACSGVFCYRVRACNGNDVCSAHTGALCATAK